jgi:short-subunit dehydrogenase involved in D-alanine esterification of teichoic acids
MKSKINNVIIFGGTSVKALSIAKEVADASNRVILVDTDRCALHLAIGLLQSVSHPQNVVAIQANLREGRQLEKLASMIYYKFGGVDQVLDCQESNSAQYHLIERKLLSKYVA